jgi:hypothetical protein
MAIFFEIQYIPHFRPTNKKLPSLNPIHKGISNNTKNEP